MVLYSALRASQNRARIALRKNLGIVVLVFIAFLGVQFLPILSATWVGLRLTYMPFFAMSVLSVLVMYGLAINAARYAFGPTAIQFGKDGIRFHWAHFGFNYSSAWVDWDLVEFACTNQVRRYVVYGIQKIDCIELKVKLWAAPAEVRNFLRLATVFGLTSGWKRDSITIRIDRGSVINEVDEHRIVSAVKAFLPPDYIDPDLEEIGSSDEDTSFTTMWLEQMDSVQIGTTHNSIEPGSIIGGGKLKIERMLAVGGNAVTYLAQDMDSSSQNLVAVKEIVLPIAGGREIYERALKNVLREAELLKKLDHKQIVKCRDFFVENGRTYLILDYIEGQTLRRFVNESGPFQEEQVLNLTKQMCEILQYLHDLKPPVIHRDFTPDNLMLRPDNTLVLIDFNVAEQREAFETATVVGKHAYIPPEQFRGQATIHSDLYALGCCIFWLLTGEDPEPITVSHPKSKKPQISQALDDFVANSTQMQSADRYQSAHEMLADEALNVVLVSE